MKSSDYYKRIEHYLSQELPGRAAQYKMAPALRKSPDALLNTDARKAGVLILLHHSREKEYYTTLIRKTLYDGVHSGQISFPGGKHEARDQDLVSTALRETEEEIGVPAKYILIIGKLTPLHIPVSNYDVQPFVGILQTEYPFKPDKKEVEEIFPIKIRKLAHPGSLVRNKSFRENERQITAPYYQYQHLKIWGATAMMLSEFIEIHHKSTLVHPPKPIRRKLPDKKTYLNLYESQKTNKPS